MAAPQNNKFWKLRSKHGRDKIFSDPAVLLDAVSEYFDYIDANPWYRNEVLRGGDAAGTIAHVPMQRPYTLKGLCHFLDIEFQTWQLYKERAEFKSAIARVEDFCYNQKFEGAAVGSFAPNIIARDLGLVEKKELTSIETGSIDYSKLPEDVLNAIIAAGNDVK